MSSDLPRSLDQLVALAKRVRGPVGNSAAVLEEMERQAVRTGLLLAQGLAAHPPKRLEDAEFSVFSQFGEDGILWCIFQQLQWEVPELFVEFGVEDYRECNTRFLLQARNWRGLVMDGSEANVAAIRAGQCSWRHRLEARAAFITRENVLGLLQDAGFGGPLGLLSVDIDGNDYWVLQALGSVNAAVVVAEYNALWNPLLPLSVPYQADFRRTAAHHSNLYWGCSLGALHHVLSARGYALVGCNRAGNNAFFVERSRLAGILREHTPQEAYRAPRFREARNQDGSLRLLDAFQASAALDGMHVVDVRDGSRVPVAQAVAPLECRR